MSDFPDINGFSLRLSGSRLRILEDILPEGSGPMIVKREKDQYVYDIDGNKYVDFNLNDGSILCGHNYKSITMHVKNALSAGSSSGYVNKLHYPLFRLFKSFAGVKHISFYDSAKTAVGAVFRNLDVKTCGVSSRWLESLASGAVPGVKPELAQRGREYDILLFEPVDFDGDLTDFNYGLYSAGWKCSVESRTAFRIKRGFMTDIEDVPMIICSGIVANGMDAAVIISQRRIEGELIPMYKCAAIMESVRIYLGKSGTFMKDIELSFKAIKLRRGSIFKTERAYQALELLKSGVILKDGTGFCCMQHTCHDIVRLEKALAKVS